MDTIPQFIESKLFQHRLSYLIKLQCKALKSPSIPYFSENIKTMFEAEKKR